MMNSKIQDLVSTVSAFALLAMLIITLVVVGAKLITNNSSVSMAGFEYADTQIIVQPGDTLWSIVKDQMPNEDPRDVVGTIRELNRLETANIYPGQVLTLQVKQAVRPVHMVTNN